MLVIDQQNNQVHSNVAGAPAGNTGSPFDNKSCARSGCHVGTATFQAGIISSNIPPTGYIPGTTYTFTNTVSQAGINKWGFQVSPMNASGNLLGTPVITNPTNTKITLSKYITHTAAGTAGIGTKTWLFSWIAPAAGTGNVTFYGAFNFTNSNGMASGDLVKTTSLTVTENLSAGVPLLTDDISEFTVSPNPVTTKFMVSFSMTKTDLVKIEIMDLSGKIINQIDKGILTTGLYQQELSMDSRHHAGLYLVSIKKDSEKYPLVKKIIKL